MGEQFMINFIKDDSRWPHWPILPLKRKKKDGSEMGVIAIGRETTVLLTNMFTMPRTDKEYDALAKLNYETVEDVVTDGWIVD